MGSASKASPYVQILKPAVNSGPMPSWNSFHTHPEAALHLFSVRPFHIMSQSQPENSLQNTGTWLIIPRGSPGSAQPQGVPFPAIGCLGLWQPLARWLHSAAQLGGFVMAHVAHSIPNVEMNAGWNRLAKEAWVEAFSQRMLGSPILLWNWLLVIRFFAVTFIIRFILCHPV